MPALRPDVHLLFALLIASRITLLITGCRITSLITGCRITLLISGCCAFGTLSRITGDA
jgi:hypothetical protein